MNKEGLVRKGISAAVSVSMALSLAGCQIEGQEPINTDNTVYSFSHNETTNKPELEGVATERLEFTKDLLNLYDVSSKQNCTGDFEGAFNKIKDFVSRNQIIEYGKTGETGENLSIIKHEDGSPALALINCNDKVTSAFEDMISEMKKDVPNYLDFLTDNEMRAFMVNRFNNNMSNSFTFNSTGLVVWNLDPKTSADRITSEYLKATVATEAFGIKCFESGHAEYAGLVKGELAKKCFLYLYNKTGNENYKKYSNETGVEYYEKIYSVDINNKEVQRKLEIIMSQNLMVPFGGSWEEIEAGIKE